MTFPISDSFDDARGRWNGYVPYSTTERFESQRDYLMLQEHVDVRTFIPEDDWTATIVSGANSDLIADKLGERGGWRGLQFTTNGDPLSITLSSSPPNSHLDLSHEHTLSIVFPDFNVFDRPNSWVQMTSDPNGVFDNFHDSSHVPFTYGDVNEVQLALNLSLFQSVSTFDLSDVTGIRIHLEGDASTDTITIMAIRAVRDTWTESALDFDTRSGNLVLPVTLDGLPYYGQALKGFEFIRGDGSRNDPIPLNGTYALIFSPGGELTSDLIHTLTGILGRDELARLLLAGVDINNLTVLTKHYNKIALIARKIDFEPEGTEDAEDDIGSGSYLKFNLYWNDEKIFYFAEKVTDSEDAFSSELVDHVFIDSLLNPARMYAFSVKLVNDTALVRLTHVDEHDKEIDDVWKHEVTSTSFTSLNGRVGFSASLTSNDAYIKAYIGAPTSFARLTSQTYRQRTPIDGAQLSTLSAPDMNLYTSMSGVDIALDATKTVSGFGSWRTTTSMTTNDFIAEDWNQMYLRIAIWIGAGTTRNSQPQIFLNTPGNQESLALRPLQATQWNYLLFDLNLFKHHLEGLSYSFSIQSQNSNPFWADNIIIGRRRVAWSLRTRPDAPFRYFWDTTNDPSGALHIPQNERGVYLQYRAEALTDDAWAAFPNLFLRHAQLGLPIYDINFERR